MCFCVQVGEVLGVAVVASAAILLVNGSVKGMPMDAHDIVFHEVWHENYCKIHVA